MIPARQKETPLEQLVLRETSESLPKLEQHRRYHMNPITIYSSFSVSLPAEKPFDKSASQLPSNRSGVRKLSGWKMGPAVFLIALAVSVVSPAQTYSILVNFTGSATGPQSFLAQGLDGNLYGTLYNNADPTLYRTTTSGDLTVLATIETGVNDYLPGLIQAPNGNLYGTTALGGPDAAGTVFEVTQAGTVTTLHDFSTHGDGGSFPGSLLLASDGNFYGITAGGGTSGYGTIFEITPAGQFRTVLTFNGANGGAANSLIQGLDGTFYGTTYLGGTGHFGTIFKVTPGSTIATLHSFVNTDGAGPYGGLVQGTDGNFYGVTVYGGDLTCDAATGCGTVFKVTPSGALTNLHNFEITDGSNPYTALIQATDGNFYGTTYFGGGIPKQGTVFQITPAGALTTLHVFNPNFGDGGNPTAALVQDTNGSLYGTTRFGGDYGGIVYVLSVPGLRPFVKTLPTSGNVGSMVDILGSNLTGATSVTFNGKSASFTVVSASEITVIVPDGATTGTVKVVTPKGPLLSNVAFRVGP
jgi:uncharacterized repeat protein (TIGR03803 family)